MYLADSKLHHTCKYHEMERWQIKMTNSKLYDYLITDNKETCIQYFLITLKRVLEEMFPRY